MSPRTGGESWISCISASDNTCVPTIFKNVSPFLERSLINLIWFREPLQMAVRKSLGMMSGMILNRLQPKFQQIGRKWKAMSESYVEAILSLQYCQVVTTKLKNVCQFLEHSFINLIWFAEFLIRLDETVWILLVSTLINLIWFGEFPIDA